MTCKAILLFIIFSIGSMERVKAQNKPSQFVVTVLWPQIESELDKDPPTQSFNFISTLVDNYHISNLDSLHKVYQDIFVIMGDRTFSAASIYVAEKLVKISQLQKNTYNQARDYTQLALQYDALGRYELLNYNIDKAIELYEKLGKKEEILLIKLNLIDRRPESVNRQKMYAEIDTLIHKIIVTGDIDLAEKAYVNSLRIAIGDSNNVYIKKYLTGVEKFLKDNPGYSKTNAPFIYLNQGKGWIAYYDGDLNQANQFFLQALKYCEVGKSRWVEVNTLQSLAMVELKRSNTSKAKIFLEAARAKAMAMASEDLLMVNFDLKAKAARAEGNYKEALTFIEKKLFHEKNFNDRSKGFNLEKYYLQLEKDKLHYEKKEQALELSLKRFQLSGSLIILVIVIFIGVFLWLALISQRKKKNELFKKNELIEEQAIQLKILDTAKSNFFANISHELRTPLSLIIGPINTILKQGLLPDKFANVLRSAHISAKQLEDMIKGLLDLRKLETGNLILYTEPTELASFFEMHIQQFESFANSKQILFVRTLEINSPVVCEIDREKNRQILYNLLSNAFKFTPRGGEVRVNVWLENNELRIRVGDNGCGIQPDEMPHIFDRFYRSNRKGIKMAGGAGIGLNICSEFAQVMNASIVANSSLEKGTEFMYSLPLVFTATNVAVDEMLDGVGEYAMMVENRGEPTVTPENLDNNKLVILVVEDNQMLQQYIKLILSDKYFIWTAENGKQALEILSGENDNHAIEMVISDVMMPVMDGFELLETLRGSDSTRHIPVILLTARAESGDKLKALRLGVDDYLTKPFEEDELQARIENLIRNKRQRAEIYSTDEWPIHNNPLPLQILKISGADLHWLTAFEIYITKNLTKENLSVPVVSTEFAMSVSTLLRQLKRLTGLSPAQYVLEMRLNEARKLIENQEYKTVSEVSAKVGFSDVRTFSRNFKSRFGKLPSELL